MPKNRSKSSNDRGRALKYRFLFQSAPGKAGGQRNVDRQSDCGPTQTHVCKPDDDHYGVCQVTGAFAWNWYWRESTHDGIYAFGSGALIDPADASHARYLGNQGDLEIRWAPMPHTIIAFNFAGFEPGTFFKTVTYSSSPIEADVGFTYRF